MFQAAFLYPLYRVWIAYLSHPVIGADGKRSWRNLLLEGSALPWWVWLVPVAYVALPVGLGTLAGVSVHRYPRISRVLVGRDPAPRAWDFLFSRQPSGLVRIQLKDGTWIGGLFADRSYAAGYPEKPEDVYLQEVWKMGRDGRFVGVLRDDAFEGHGALLRWEEVKFLEFLHLRREVVET